MPDLTVANYLGMLLEDPYDTRLVKELRQLLNSEPANKNAQDPLSDAQITYNYITRLMDNPPADWVRGGLE